MASDGPAFEPEYNKPDAPGIHMNFDNTVSIYQVVTREQSFDEAAAEAFSLLREAQEQFPDWPRVYYLDVAGHDGEHLGFTRDFFEFQQDFLFSTVAHFVTALETPITGGLVNPEPQRNDVPDELVVSAKTNDNGDTANASEEDPA
ncbi:MAG: hypothetical protein GVY12_11370 [Bacteroidetes bacterium]|jgi:hypothetical protein|nr:hypothetical protein [Bacteroidota bacterium]